MLPKTQQQKQVEQIMASLDELGGKLTAEEDIVFEGVKLILPETMTMDEAIHFLKNKRNEDEQDMRYFRQFNYRPMDGAHATMTALRRQFGAIMQVGRMGLFGEEPPAMVTINVSATETTQVPWGDMRVAHLPGLTLRLGTTRHDEYGEVFYIGGSGPRKYRFRVEGLFNLIERELQENSIYKGKAFDGKMGYMDLSKFDRSKVIYAKETEEHIEANLWSLLRYTDRIEDLGMPLKRAVLFEGPYGSGKSMTAKSTAQIAIENGWTFIECKAGRDDLFEVMNTARLYQPAVVFFEDVDTLADAGASNVTKLLDVFDGISAKDTKIICVLTTNHVENIHKGMLRPGRLDALIHIGHLDEDGTRRMVEAHVEPEHREADLDWEMIAKAMDGYVPCFMVEAIHRAGRYSMTRHKGAVRPLDTQDFVLAAEGLREHLERMEGAKDTAPRDTVAKALRGIVQDVVTNVRVVDQDDDYHRYNLKVAE